MNIMFETGLGDELDPEDLKNATWKVTETFVDVDVDGEIVFTYRIEPHSMDDMTVEGLEG